MLIGEPSHAASLGTIDQALEPYLYARSILITTHKPLAALGQVLQDGDLAEGIRDSVLERGAHFQMRGRSYRTHLENK